MIWRVLDRRMTLWIVLLVVLMLALLGFRWNQLNASTELLDTPNALFREAMAEQGEYWPLGWISVVGLEILGPGLFWLVTLVTVGIISLTRFRHIKALIQVLFILFFWKLIRGTLGLSSVWTAWDYTLRMALYALAWMVFLYYAFERGETTQPRLLGRCLLTALASALLLALAYPILAWSVTVYALLAVLIMAGSVLMIRWGLREEGTKLMDEGMIRMMWINGIVTAIGWLLTVIHFALVNRFIL